jgi:DNA-binding NarL/FixJ family response regulator
MHFSQRRKENIGRRKGETQIEADAARNMQKEITLVIADDHPVFRQGLRQAIDVEQNLTVLGEASNGQAALAMIQELRPNVAVLDVNMPEMKGFDVAREIQRRELPVGVIFLTMYDDERMFNEALNAGAKGYLLKDSAICDIVTSIRTVAAGQLYISAAISNYLVNRAARGAALDKQAPGLKDLTPTELRILKLIARNESSKAIAEQLFISYRTVENHRYSICQKLGLHGNNALVRFALEHRAELS